jgi:hypothetical protein
VGPRITRGPTVLLSPLARKVAGADPAARASCRTGEAGSSLGEGQVEFAALGAGQERLPLGTGVDVRRPTAVL